MPLLIIRSSEEDTRAEGETLVRAAPMGPGRIQGQLRKAVVSRMGGKGSPRELVYFLKVLRSVSRTVISIASALCWKSLEH